MRVELKTRVRMGLGQLEPSTSFVCVNESVLFQVVDLIQADVFKQPAPVLRDDLTYVVEVGTGVLKAFPKSLKVELVEVVVSEV